MTSRPLPDQTGARPWPSPVSCIILFGIGGLLAGMHLYDLFLELGNPGHTLWTPLFWASLAESVLGIGPATAVLALGVHVSARSEGQVYRVDTAKGCLVGFAGALGVGLVLLLLREIRGGAAPMVYTLASAGAFAGTLVGYFQAQSTHARRELRSITENVSEGIYRSTPEQGIVYANQAFAEMFGYESVEEILQVDPAASLYADAAERERRLQNLQEAGNFRGHEIEFRRKDGSTFIGRVSGTVVQGSGGREDGGDVKCYDGAITDITDQRKAWRQLQRQSELERMIVKISARFIDAPTERLDTEIEEALAAVGSFVGADRSYVFLYDGDPEAEEPGEVTESNTHEWCAGGAAPQKENLQDIPCSEIPWWTEQMLKKEPLRIPSVSDLPEAASAEQEILDAQNIESLVVLPMTQEGALTGFVGFDAVGHAAAWDEKTTRVLQVLSDAIASALRRRDDERRLRETRDFYRQVLDQLPVELAIFDPEGRFQYVNPQALGDPEQRAWIQGHTHEEYFRKYACADGRERPGGTDVVDLGRRRDEAVQAAARKERTTRIKETISAEAEGAQANGVEEGPLHYVRIHKPITNRAGEVTSVVGCGLDITERERGRHQLERYREYTDRLLNAIDDLFFVLGKEGTLQRWNDRLPEVTGYSDEELEGMSAFDLVPEEDGERVAENIGEAFTSGRVQIEVPLVRKDGTRVAYEFMGNLVKRPDGEPQVVGIGRDITEQKQRKRELGRQNDLFEKAQDIADVGAWEYDVRAEALTWTEEVYRIHDLPVGHVLTPEEALAFYHPEDRPKVASLFGRAVEDGESYDIEARLITEQGEPRWIRTRGEAQRGDDGEIARIRGTTQDITERKRQEWVLRERQEKIEALYEATGTLLRAEDTREVPGRLASIVDDALGYPATTIRLAEGDRLEPTCVLPAVQDYMPERPAYDIDGDTPAARAYRTGTSRVYDDLSAQAEGLDRGDIRATAYVPMGSRGLISVGSTKVGGIDAFDRQLLEV
ncbi:MAG: PAS domain S-box protein, partial [Salinibacter sp.]|uniref:PAS domain S-box protein n=1 Tax=Salinibacter sp. TaxID=2065818 RepID=UPI002FC3A7FC